MLMLERSVTSPGYPGPVRQATYGRREWSVDVGLLMLTEGEGKTPADTGCAPGGLDRRPQGRGQEEEGGRAVGLGSTGGEGGQGTPGGRSHHTSGSDSRGGPDSHSDNSNSGDALSSASFDIKSRKTREFTPDCRKDQSYWEKRRKNNEAARRSREKRRIHDIALESRLAQMDGENRALRRELAAIKQHFGLPLDEPFLGEEEEPCPPHPVSVASPSLPGPPPSHLSPPQLTSVKTYSTTMTSALPPAPLHSAPPPLLTVASAVPMGMSVPSVHHSCSSSNGAPLPYYFSMAGEGGGHGMPHYSHGAPPPHAVPTTCLQPPYHPAVYSSAVIKTEPPEEEGPYPKRTMYEPLRREPGPAHLPDPLPHRSGLSLYGKTRPIPTAHLAPGPESTSEGWGGSPSNSCTDEDTADEPLQLTVRRDREAVPYPPEPKSPGYASLPVKLRHKMPMDFRSTLSPSPPYPPAFVNGLAQLSETSLSQSSPLPLLKKEGLTMADYHEFEREELSLSGGGETGGSHKSGGKTGKDPKVLDPKYIERRKRNNEAARKCRENRKTLTRLREAKSDFLESENTKLRNEVESLQEEMKQLRDLIEKKRVEQGLPPQGGEGIAG